MRGQLGALPHDQVGTEVLHGREHPCQPGSHPRTGEDLGQDDGRRLVVAQVREPGQDRAPLLGRGVGERPVPEPCPGHVGGERRAGGDHDLVPGPTAGVDERDKRPEVARPRGGRHEYAPKRLSSVPRRTPARRIPARVSLDDLIGAGGHATPTPTCQWPAGGAARACRPGTGRARPSVMVVMDITRGSWSRPHPARAGGFGSAVGPPPPDRAIPEVFQGLTARWGGIGLVLVT